MHELLRRFQYLLHRRRLERELAAEMEAHREMAAQAGNAPFGSMLRLREEAREAWGWTWLDRLTQDLRYAVRVFARSPGFTIAATLTLALGIGVNLAAFGFFNLMVLKPLPVRDPVSLRSFSRQSAGSFADNIPYAAVAFYRDHTRTLSAVMALAFGNLSLEGAEGQLKARFVTSNFFSELGGGAACGRVFDPARDDAADAGAAVVLGFRFWQLQFHADPAVVGRTLRLNGKPATVLGVAAEQFSGLGLDIPDVWIPITRQPYFVADAPPLAEFSDRGLSVTMWGRLQPGLPPRAAEEELRVLAAELHRLYPKLIWQNESLPSDPAGYAIHLLPGRSPMIPLLAIVGTLCLLILVVACGNVGGLLLARGVAREHEISIRASIGAGRARLVRQLFTESLLLALLGSAAGLLFGWIALRVLMTWTGVPAWLNPAPDYRVILFAVAVGFGAAVLFGLAPALQVSKKRHRTTMARQFLIGGQVAASCVLLIVAGLLIRAVQHATHADPGFEYQHVLSIDPHLGGTPAEARAYFDSLGERLLRLPGVESVALASNPPLGNRWTVVNTEIAGHAVSVHFNGVSAEFFRTMQIPLLRGRLPAPNEPRVVVVSESLARLEWPGEDPIGKAFRLPNETSDASRRMVVGVVGSARLVSPEDSDAVEVYEAVQPASLPSLVMLVRTAAPPETVLGSIAAAVKGADAKRFPTLKLMKSGYSEKLRISEYAAAAIGTLGAIALALACLGIVGLIAYSVSQRTREIGIRRALGAPSLHVLGLVLWQFVRPVGAGLAVGAGGAIALSQLLRRMLFGLSHLDAAAYLLALGVFAVAVALAALPPARRACRVDPARALRYE